MSLARPSPMLRAGKPAIKIASIPRLCLQTSEKAWLASLHSALAQLQHRLPDIALTRRTRAAASTAEDGQHRPARRQLLLLPGTRACFEQLLAAQARPSVLPRACAAATCASCVVSTPARGKLQVARACLRVSAAFART